jgi:hypothetical protein
VRGLNDITKTRPIRSLAIWGCEGGFLWPIWTEDDGYESNPQLRKFIDDDDVLIDELTLVKGTKPVRFFARRDPASPLD